MSGGVGERVAEASVIVVLPDWARLVADMAAIRSDYATRREGAPSASRWPGWPSPVLGSGVAG